MEFLLYRKIWLLWPRGKGSRKVRNPACDLLCTVTAEDPMNIVIVEGVAKLVSAPDELLMPT